jgi:hypothetical protein
MGRAARAKQASAAKAPAATAAPVAPQPITLTGEHYWKLVAMSQMRGQAEDRLNAAAVACQEARREHQALITELGTSYGFDPKVAGFDMDHRTLSIVPVIAPAAQGQPAEPGK